MSNAEEVPTLADKAMDVAGKAASGIAAGFKKASSVATTKISAASGSTLIVVMRVLNISLAVLLIICYPIGIANGHTGMSFTTFFMVVYCISFSLLIIIFETGMKRFEVFIKKYFGFIYSYVGRSLFTLFTVAMVLGQGKSNTSVYILNIIVSIIGIMICIFNCLVVCKHPAFQKGGEFYAAGLEEDAPAATAAPAKKPTESKNAAKPVSTASYEANPFESSSDEDIPKAKVPGEKSPAKKSKKAKQDNPFEDDNPFDD